VEQGRGTVESLGLKDFAGIYAGKRVLITGHTGFKGSWLALWMKHLGAEVAGMSLPPETSPNHWDMLALDINEYLQDIRDADSTTAVIRDVNPDLVFHLAAQSLVRRSYRDPLSTWSTNVMGTVNILEACRLTSSVQAIVVVTTDKCYENLERDTGYRETDRLGGHDPYSASKASTELVAASYRKSFFANAGLPLLATARAGNVIGGGDWSEDRLIPDIARAVIDGIPIVIRSPKATRPWQHVLEPLSGYLMLGQKLLERNPDFADAWNFGPDDSGNQPVETVLKLMQKNWSELNWEIDKSPQPHEAKLLHLNSAMAREKLSWLPIWDLDQCLSATADWYRCYLEEKTIITGRQLLEYTNAAQNLGLSWAVP
jgi:CDP-glucose 4,6-dehydratase